MKEKLVNLRLTQSKEGHWLHFKDSKGKKAGINIEDELMNLGPCIRQWARDQFDGETCFSCSHELKGNCTLEEVEEASGITGYMNVEYNMMRKNKPHNCPLDYRQMKQLTMDKKLLELLGFKKKVYQQSGKTAYEIPCMNGVFYYNENETIYKWYQRISVNGCSSHTHLNIKTLEELVTILKCFELNK